MLGGAGGSQGPCAPQGKMTPNAQGPSINLGIWNFGGPRCVVQLCQTQKFCVIYRDLLGILIGKVWSLFLTLVVQDIFNNFPSPNEQR